MRQPAGIRPLSAIRTNRSVRRGRVGAWDLVRDTTASESTEPQLIRARRGVIFASGGFERNEQMRINYQQARWRAGATTFGDHRAMCTLPLSPLGNAAVAVVAAGIGTRRRL